MVFISFLMVQHQWLVPVHSSIAYTSLAVLVNSMPNLCIYCQYLVLIFVNIQSLLLRMYGVHHAKLGLLIIRSTTSCSTTSIGFASFKSLRCSHVILPCFHYMRNISPKWSSSSTHSLLKLQCHPLCNDKAIPLIVDNLLKEKVLMPFLIHLC